MTDRSDPPLGFCASCGAPRIVAGQSHCASCGQKLLQPSEIARGPAPAAAVAAAQAPPEFQAIPAPPAPIPQQPAAQPEALPPAFLPVPPPLPACPRCGAHLLAGAAPCPACGWAANPAPVPSWAAQPAGPGPAAPPPAPARRNSTPIFVGLGVLGLVAIIIAGALLVLKPGGGLTGTLGPTGSLSPAPATPASTAIPTQAALASSAAPTQATPAPTAAATPTEGTPTAAILKVNPAAMAVVASWGSDVTVWTSAANPATTLLGLPDGAVGLRDFPAQMTVAGALFDALGEHRTSWYVCGGGADDPFGQCPSIRVWFDRGTVTSVPGAIPVVFEAE